MGQLAVAQDQVPDHQEPAGRPGHRDLPEQDRLGARRDRLHGDPAIGQLIDPAAIAEADLEGRRHRQQLPARTDIRQDAQAVAADDVVGIARDREQLVERGVAQGQLGREHAVHPAGDAHRGLVQQHALAGPQNGAVAAADPALLGGQHDMPIVLAIRHEERPELPLALLLQRARRIELGQHRSLEVLGRQCWRALEQAVPGRRQGDRRLVGPIPSRRQTIDPGQIAGPGSARMIRIEQAEERPAGGPVRRQGLRAALNHRAGGFMLQPLVRQIGERRQTGLAGCAIGRSEQLHRIGGIGGSAVQAAMQDQRMPAVLGHGLPAHDDRPEPRMGRAMVVEILRGEGLVGHQEAAIAEPDVLHQDGIASDLAGLPVGKLDLPEPSGLIRLQPKRHAVPDAGGFAFPDASVAGRADLDLGLRPDHLEGAGSRPPDADIDPAEAAGERRGQDLVDHDPAALALMLEREQAAIGQQAGLKAAATADPLQPKVSLSRRRSLRVGRARHATLRFVSRPARAGPQCRILIARPMAGG